MSRITHGGQLTKDGHPHREHRSKKGRSYRPDYWRVVDFKRKLDEKKEKELLKENL